MFCIVTEASFSPVRAYLLRLQIWVRACFGYAFIPECGGALRCVRLRQCQLLHSDSVAGVAGTFRHYRFSLDSCLLTWRQRVATWCRPSMCFGMEKQCADAACPLACALPCILNVPALVVCSAGTPSVERIKGNIAEFTAQCCGNCGPFISRNVSRYAMQCIFRPFHRERCKVGMCGAHRVPPIIAKNAATASSPRNSRNRFHLPTTYKVTPSVPTVRYRQCPCKA